MVLPEVRAFPCLFLKLDAAGPAADFDVRGESWVETGRGYILLHGLSPPEPASYHSPRTTCCDSGIVRRRASIL